MSYPDTNAFPYSGLYIPVIMLISDVLPAPLGPSSPNISPFFRQRQKSTTAILAGRPP